MPDNVDKLFEIMQAKGAASDRDKFRKVFLTPGNKGYKIRKDIYDGLRADGIIDSPTYEDFRRKLRLGGTPTVNKYRQQMFSSVDPNKSRASELTHRAVGQAVRATNNVRKPVTAKVVNQKGKPTGKEFAITPAKTVEDLDREYAQEATKNWENELHDQMADADKDAAKISDMFKSFIGSTDEVGSVWGNMTRGGGIAGTPHSVTTNNGILENTEARQILAAGDYNRKRRELLQLEKDSRNGAIFDNHSFFRGMYDAAKDTGFLTGGASDLINAGSLLATKQDLDNGVHTEAGDMLMQQAVKNSDAQSQYGDNQGWMYTGGVITTNMTPFMMQVASAGFSKGMSNAIGKVVQGAASKVALGTMKKATGMAGAHIANYIGKVTGLTTKAFGKAIQYGIVGAAQANTVGLGNVANDVINRYTGQVYQDEQGNYKFGTFDSDGKLVHEGGEDFLTALVKGEAAQTIEFATELAGGGIDAVGTALKNFVTKGGKKIINKYNMENVSKVIDFLLNNKVAKNARYLKAGADRTLGKVEVNSIVGESLEEELGIIANTVFTGDNKISDLWDEKQQSQIWGGMLLSIGLMKGAVAPFHAYNAKQYYSYKHKLDKADVNLSQLLGKEKWEELRNQIDATTNDDMPEMVNKINRDVALGKNRQPVREYIQNLLIMRGYDIGNMLAAKKAVEDKGEGVSVKNMEKNQAYQQGRDAYGYDTHEIQLDQEDKQKSLAQLLGISEHQLASMSDEELEALSGHDDNIDRAIYDYQLFTARYEGVIDNARDQIDLEVQRAAQAVDMYTDKSRNTIRNATIKATGGLEDYGVYIINGNIATHEDGSIDISNSDDMILYYDPTTNTVEHADAMMFAELGSEENADEVRSQAMADAKEKAIKETTGIIDGVVDVGTQFKTVDADGTEHTYEVLADNGDGTAMITIDGNIPTELVKGENVNVPVSFEELQKMKDESDQQRLQAAKAEREQMEKKRTERQNQQTEQTEETQPSFDFNQILNDDGNVVLVDVLDKDSNTKYPNSQLFLIRDSGAKAKVMELTSDGSFIPHAVNKKDVRTATTMTLDEYKQAMAESSMIEDNSGESRGEIEVETPTIEGETAAPESAETPATEQTPAVPAITLEDGTIVPMLEDGNPDFSKLTAAQTAELYDSQFGEDADSIVSGYVSDAKKALDKASNMTVKGKTFVEQKAAKDAKEKAIADAKAAYDSAIAIRDAYNERQLAKVEDTAEGRKELIEKARRKFARLKSAVKDDAEAVAQIYKETVGSLLHRLYDGTGIDVTDTIPLTAEEYVASNLGAHSLNYEGTETSKGVKQETGLSREDFAKTQLLAADGKGTTIDNLVHSLWENRPSNLDSLDTQDIRNALLSIITSGFKASEARNYIENLRIAQAENILEEQKKAADNAAFAEEQKAKQEEEDKKAEENAEEKAEEKTHSESFNKIVDLAKNLEEILDNPDNVKEIDKITHEIDELLENLSDKEFKEVSDVLLNIDEDLEYLTADEYERREGVEESKKAKAYNESLQQAIKRISPYADALKAAVKSDDKKAIAKARKELTDALLASNLGHGYLSGQLEYAKSAKKKDESYSERRALVKPLTDAIDAIESALDSALAEAGLEGVHVDFTEGGHGWIYADKGSAWSSRLKALDNDYRNVSQYETQNPISVLPQVTIDNVEKVAGIIKSRIEEGERYNSDEYNDEDEQTKFPDKLKEGSETIEVPEDATDEKPLGEQISKDKVPFEIKGEKSGETYDINDKEDRKRLVAENSVDDKDILDIDMPKHVHKAIKELCKKMGLKVQFLYMGARSNGWIENGTMYLALDTEKATQFVFGHEMTHAIKQKNPEAYKELVKVAMAITTRKKFEEDLAKIYQNYYGISGYNNIDDYVEEVVADKLGKFINDFDLAQKFSLRLNHPVLATILHAIQKIKGLLYGDFYKSVDALERIVEKAYVDTAKGEVTNSETGEDVSFSLRQKPEPKKKGIGYKVFVLKDGKLYPPMVANPDGAATPVGVWLDADAAPIAGESKTGRPQVKQGGKGTQGGSGKLAYRPGWHLGVVPYAIQFNRKDAEGNKTLFPKNFVFAEVEYAADVDYQEEARQEGINPSGKYQHSLAGLKHLPTDGYYMYRTNPNPETDPWVITGAMKVNRILTRAEQAELVKNAGREPQQIQEGDIVTDDVVNSINQEIADAPKFSIKTYHGSQASFDKFDHSFMGSGEGAQAYGWGTYVSEVEGIAKAYAKQNTAKRNTEYTVAKRAYEDAETEYKNLTNYIADSELNINMYNIPSLENNKKKLEMYKEKGIQHWVEVYEQRVERGEKTIKEERERIEEYKLKQKEAYKLMDEAKKKLDSIEKPKRNLYSVDIPDDTGRNYIGWDEPLGAAKIMRLPKVFKADGWEYKKVGMYDTYKIDGNEHEVWLEPSLTTGKELYRDLTNALGSDKAASEFLSKAGFVGVKVIALRNAGGNKEGKMNYVIFDENNAQITSHTKFSLKKVNDAFNQRLDELVKNPNQKDKILRLGRSSSFLKAGGIADAEIELDFDKLMRKSKQGYVHEHPFDATDVKDLPMAIANPISVFDNTNGRNDGQVILTELKKEDRNFIVAIQTENQNRKGGVVLKVNKIVTLFPKDARGVINWFNQGKATNIDKEKALHFIEALQNHSGTTITDEELKSAANIINSFETTKENGEKVDVDGTKFSLKDEEYLKAVEDGNMEKAQKMVNEAADAAGYSTDSSYQGTSAFNGAAPWGNGYFLTKDERKEAWDNGEFEGESTLGDYINDDIDGGNLEELTNAASYRAADPMRKEAIDNVRNAIQKKAKTITMYRSVPSDVKEGSFRNGDWVTPSRAYAVDNAKLHGWGDDYNIIEQKVPVDDVWFDGNDIAEWGYGREEDYINDTDFAYKNSKNNKKLLDAVTYDDNGNVIPLSQRFNEKNKDVRFSLKDEKTLAGVHNITEEKLRKALKLGGFANPSLAVIDTNKTGHDNFGEISFIAPSALLDKRTGNTGGTWITDAYTQRYPSVEREMSEKGYRKFEDWVDSLDYPSGAKAEIERQAKDALSDNNAPAWELMYLKEKGIDIKEYDSRIDYRWKEIISDHPTAEDILNSMKTDPELNEKVTSLAKHAIIHPTWEKVSLEVRRKMYKETGVKASPINPQVRKQTKEIFERDYAPTLLNKDGSPRKKDVKKVVEDIVKEHNDTKKYDFYLSKVKASNYVNKNGLYDDYIRWQENKLDEFGTKNRIFRGYTRDGSRKYVPETLENVSKAMREEADGQTNGSEYTSFGSFIAKLASRVDSTDEMRANKDKLSSNKDKEEFYEKWSDVYYDLAKFLYNDVFYGEQRLHDIVLQSDPKKYAKKEYGITLTPTFMKKLDALKNAVQTELKSAYFETKYNRPLRLNEFAAAVVPDNLGKDVRKGIENAGLPMYDYDPNKEGDRSRAFNEAINSSDNIRFSLAGVRGAAAADKAEERNARMDNLSVARKMEEEKKDAKAIKMATGWERGADGKWRYEIPDAKIKDTMNVGGGQIVKRYEDDMLWNGGKLSDVIDAPELFKAYPQLKGVRIDTDAIMNDMPSHGEYDSKTNTITIHADELKYMNDILNHEIQHAIQDIEGFAKGGSPRLVRGEVKKRFDEVTKQIKQLRAEGKEDEAKALIEKNRGLYDAYMKNDDFNSYKSLAGEVEARNVQERMNMTPEERRKTLAESTEDVARKDQIFLGVGDVSFSLRDMADGKESGAADMAEDLKSLNTPDEVDDAIKTAIDDMPNGWKMANKKMIHIAQALGENRKAEIAGEEPKFSLKDGTLIKAGTYFSGGGLVEEGLKGIIDPVVAVEYDEKISGVYRNNFGQHIVTADVRDVDPKELVKQIDGEVEYFHASPVCKNYSQAKSNHAEVELDKETAASTAEFINAIKPKVVTIENVKGYKDSEAMKTITDALDANGYTWDADVYNAADYGGYTNRERLIVRAVRDGKLPAKPEKMARKSGWYEAVADIIPTLTEKKNGVAPWMDIRLKADGIDWRNIDKPLYVMGSAYADGKVPHAFADELLPTLRTKSGDVIVMPDGKVYRAMGRVLARVSGVSDDYKMPFSENLSHIIIGNGIPTQLTEHVIAPLLTGSDPKFSIRTYHGTGASFDKFDLSHALEGEGSETFGHGVYVTNSSKIGREYAQRAKQRKMADLYKNMRYTDGVKGDIFKRRVFGEMVNDVATGGSVASAKDFAKKRVGADANDIQRTLENLKDREKGTEYEQNLKDRLAEYKEGLKWIDSLDEDYLTQGNANRYDVDIPDDNGENYLGWNESQNFPLEKWYRLWEITHHGFNENEYFNDGGARYDKDRIERIIQMKLESPENGMQKLPTLKGEELYHALEDFFDRERPSHGAELASRALSEIGFVGIKYPAGLIHGGAEEGDYNYVIFDENNANIVGNTRFSLRYDQFEHDLNQWKKDNNLPKDAQRPTIPQRNAGESAVDFLRRVDEYRKQMALWKTAPTYEQHLLSDDTALGEFNRELQRGSVLKRIAFQDSMLAIRKAQEAIMKEVGVDRLNMAEDAYTAENRSHGKGKNEFEEYNNEFLQPLRKAYHQMKKVLGDSYDNVRIYMMAKHGLERDAQMAFKKSLDADFEDVAQRSAAYKAYKGDMNRIINDSDLEFGRVDFNTWRQRDNALRAKYSPSYMDYRYDKNGIAYDYSGLSALFDGSDFEEAAYKLVKDIEDKYVTETHNLWDATNAATKKILRDGYKAGMMSKDTYQYVRDMYSHYIPLRGWDGTTADQVWDYIGGGKGAFNQTLKKAHGRTSIADDPIAYIENMAESGILLNNKNWVKQHLMLLAQNHPTSLLTLSKAWYVKSTDANGNEEWIPATPQITSQMNSNQVKAAIDAFEQKMEQMAQAGDATQKRDGLNIAYPQTHSEEREHEVRVMKDGEEYVIYVNGDPQLAQAMNNTRAHRVREIQSGKLDRAAAWLGRKMAAAYTSLSPLFIPSNYFRDLTMTLSSTAIREDAKYNYLLRKNLATSWNLGFMLRDFQNGKLRDKVNNGNATPKEQMFYDFMMNGGETGFVSSLDVEDLKKKFKNDLKDLDRWKTNLVKVGHTIMDSIEFLNRAIEDSNRFAVYMTSIQCGRSVDEAVNDAKDVTLNFNRKGTGEYGWQMIRNLYLFINPAVQSLQTLGALAKHHPFKFTAVTASWLASGVLVPIVNVALMQLGAAFLGGDGDDDKDWYKDISKKYWQFSKWDRRNNFIMWVPTTHEFVKIPLAQEFRAFYGLGDMIASKMMGGELAEESWEDYGWDLVGQVVDMLPLDPTGYDGNIAVSLMPNAIRPVFELAFNVDFTGKPLFKETEYNKYDPNFTKAYVGTPDWLVRASRMMNSIGNDYPDVQQNKWDAFGDPRYNLNNPAVVDHVLSSYLGGAYTMGSQVLGLLTKSLNDPKEIKVADIPLFSKFVSNPDDRPVTKKQGDEFWNMKENHDRASNTLSKLKKQAKVDGDYSMLERFYGSEEYKKYKQDDVKVKKYEEDKKKERAEDSGEEYRPHKLNAEDIYKAHATPKDDFEDLKLKQLYTKLNGFKTSYDLLVDTASSQSDGYYNNNKAAIDAIDEISLDKQEISELKKGFLYDGKDAYNAEDMKQIRDLRKKILSVLEKANKVVVANQKAKAKK
jgi:hypothetical protein